MMGTRTIERHRSRLIPDVDLGGDGRLVVADHDGTFPARGSPSKDRNSLPEFEVDAKSFRSYDAKREPKRRQRISEPSRFGEEVKRLSGTLKSQSSSASLQKKIRRLRGEEHPARTYSWQYDSNHPARYFGSIERGTWSSHGNNRRKVDKKRRLSVDYPSPANRRNSLSSKSNSKVLDITAIKDYRDKKKKNARANSILEIYNADLSPYANPGNPPLVKETSRLGLAKRLVEEELPSLIFLVTGGCLLATGIAHALISQWHIFYCMIWSGVLVLMMGITGRFHRLDYLTKWLNGIYIASGILSSVAVMATIASILQVSVPLVINLSDNIGASDVITRVTFTWSENSIISSLSTSQMVWASLAVEVIAFVFCLVQFFGLTATLVAISNHWDAAYLSTSECNYRGQPRFFNPFEQASIAQASGLFGIFVFVLWPDQNTGPQNYACTLWAPALVFLASLAGICHGKREDLHKLGYLSFAMQSLALLSITLSAIFVLLGLVDNIDNLSNGSLDSVVQKELMASSVFDGFYVGCVFINVIFLIGFLIKEARKICGCECFSLNESNS